MEECARAGGATLVGVGSGWGRPGRVEGVGADQQALRCALHAMSGGAQGAPGGAAERGAGEKWVVCMHACVAKV